jgi:superfamily I DNA/RNA helicase
MSDPQEPSHDTSGLSVLALILRFHGVAVDTVIRLTEKGKELEGSTIATLSGKAGSPHHLNLITMHSVKGLEYDVVFLLGMDQGRLPSRRDKHARQESRSQETFLRWRNPCKA